MQELLYPQECLSSAYPSHVRTRERPKGWGEDFSELSNLRPFAAFQPVMHRRRKGAPMGRGLISLGDPRSPGAAGWGDGDAESDGPGGEEGRATCLRKEQARQGRCLRALREA